MCERKIQRVSEWEKESPVTPPCRVEPWDIKKEVSGVKLQATNMCLLDNMRMEPVSLSSKLCPKARPFPTVKPGRKPEDTCPYIQ